MGHAMNHEFHGFPPGRTCFSVGHSPDEAEGEFRCGRVGLIGFGYSPHLPLLPRPPALFLLSFRLARNRGAPVAALACKGRKLRPIQVSAATCRHSGKQRACPESIEGLALPVRRSLDVGGSGSKGRSETGIGFLKPPPESLKKTSHGVVQRWKTLAVGNSGTRRD